jgi:hypothetical protein
MEMRRLSSRVGIKGERVVDALAVEPDVGIGIVTRVVLVVEVLNAETGSPSDMDGDSEGCLRRVADMLRGGW